MFFIRSEVNKVLKLCPVVKKEDQNICVVSNNINCSLAGKMYCTLRVVDAANVFLEGEREAKSQGEPEFPPVNLRTLGPCMTSAEVTGSARVVDTATVFFRREDG